MRLLRQKQVLTQAQASEKLGVAQSTLASWENDLRRPSSSALIRLAEFFAVPLDYLLGRMGDIDPAKLAAESKKRQQGIKIPVLGSIHAGVPIVAIEEVEDWEEIPEALARTGEYIALRVSGDSMTPEIRNGDVAIIRRQEDIESGQIAAVLVNGEEATLKQIKKTAQGIVLVGLNPAVYAPHLYTWDEVSALPVRIYGKLVEVRRKY